MFFVDLGARLSKSSRLHALDSYLEENFSRLPSYIKLGEKHSGLDAVAVPLTGVELRPSAKQRVAIVIKKYPNSNNNVIINIKTHRANERDRVT